MCSETLYKLLWCTSIYAIVFFTFLQISLARQPEFLIFTPKRVPQTSNTCLIITIIYVGVFVVTSALWFRDICVKKAIPEYSIFVEENPNKPVQVDSPSTERMMLASK